MRGVWQPILTDPLAERVCEAAECVIEALRRFPSSHFRGPLEQADAALALAYAAFVPSGKAPVPSSGKAGPIGSPWPRDSYAQAAAQHLDEAFEGVAGAEMSVSLFEGFVGVAWVTEHLGARYFEVEEGLDPNECVDEVLRLLLEQPLWRGSYDLISGLAGIGVYLLERLYKPGALDLLEKVVSHLEEQAKLWEIGSTRKLDLGVAHGLPGIVAFLGEVCGIEIDGVTALRRRAKELAESTVDVLMAHRLDTGGFPAKVTPGTKPEACRLAWCYGDAGVAAALLGAARRVGVTAWEEIALETALLAAHRPPELSGVVDSGLCHGAAGLAHIFNRIFQATQEEVFREAARFWIEKILSLRHPTRGIGGFPAYGSKGWKEAPDFLIGAAGVAMALIAATTEMEPSWDRRLLLSIPIASYPAGSSAEMS